MPFILDSVKLKFLFQNELIRELPQIPPFRCPFEKCSFDVKDNNLLPLLKHYGNEHKAFLNHLNGQIVGRSADLKNDF